MTNEAVAVTQKLTCELQNQLGQGQEAVHTATQWFSEKGIPFAINVAVAALMFLVGWLIIRLVSAAVRKAVARKGNPRSLLASFACSVVTKSCWAVLAVMILSRLGVDVTPLVAGLGVTGFILGFAFKESLGNLASGMMIALNEPFKVGDYISAAGLEGSVLEVNMMATVMSTPDNKRIVVPNTNIWGGPIVNFSAMPTRRTEIAIGVAYATDLARAMEVALATARAIPGVIAEPAPTVAVSSLDSSQITLCVRMWMKNADYWPVTNAAAKGLPEAFAKAGIDIPFPQLDVRVTERK